MWTALKLAGQAKATLVKIASLCAASTPIDIERRVRFGETKLLRFRQDVGELPALLAHGTQNVIARAIQDSVDSVQPIAGETLPQGSDDRYAAGNRGFVSKADPGIVGGSPEIRPVQCEHGFVRRHHMFSIRNRSSA